MADVERLKRALVNADRAGDAEAATVLAKALRQQMQSMPEQAPKKMGSILPISRDESGWGFDSDAGILGALKGIARIPERVMTAPQIDPSTGRTSDELIRATTDAAMVFGPVSPASRLAPARNMAGKRVTATPEVPSADDLLATGSRQFDEGRALGVKYEPAYIQKMGREAEARMMQEGFDVTNAPKTFSVLKDMQSEAAPGAFAAYDDILKIRNRLKKARMDFNNPADKDAAERLIRVVEGFVSKAPGTGAVRSGPAASLADTHRNALGNYAAAKRSTDLGNLESSAVRRAAASNSGQNIGNTIRQRAASLLDSPKKIKGFTAKEIEALEQVSRGTATQNALRDVAHYLGGGGGLGGLAAGGLAAGVGTQIGGIPGGLAATAGVVAAGRGAKAATNNLTLRSMRNVDKMTRMRSPLYQEMIKSPEWKTANAAQRSAMLKLLFSSAVMEEPRSSGAQ